MGTFGLVSVSLLVLSWQTSLAAADCKITLATPSGPTSILVQWEPYVGATNYFLDLRVRNNTNFAPVVGMLQASGTQKNVQGLRPGTRYAVTLKVFQYYFVMCRYTTEASTVPATSQIVRSEALTSTSISVQWTVVPSAEQYLLQVRSQRSGQVVEVMQSGVSAVIEDLTPSTNYDSVVFTVNHAGRGSPSQVRTVTTLTQPPPEVTVTQTGLSSALIQWDPVSDVLLYRVIVRQAGASQSNTYNVSGTSLDVGGILACSSYLISVSSYNKFLVPSEPTVSTYTTNSLTPVPEVTVDYHCFQNLATVHWVSVPGADSYRAVALSQGDGPQLMCTSSATSCLLEGVRCGQTYTLHVTPLSENCENMENVTSATFTSVPCPPGNLTLLRDCSSEVIVFSWDRTNHTDHYLARAVDSQGEVQECLTEDNSCYFTHTVCGRHYYFSVLSIWDQCRSAASVTADIRTAPCIPHNLQTSADCNSNVLVSTWDLAEGALRYTVEAFGNRGHSHYNCSSLSNSCAMEGVQCGDFLTIYITAHDDECSSPRTLGPTAGTVPCEPENSTAVRDCGSDSVTVTWNMSWGAIFYVAVVRDGSGALHSCNSMDLTCQIVGLRCGTVYTAHVIASNFLCNSTESDGVIVETAQCPPDHVSASLDCEANEAVVSWRELPGVNSYTASIVDEEQVLLSCSATTTSCRVPHLKCSQTYTVTVRYHDGICPSMPSQPIQMVSVPCGPQVAASVDCGAHALEIGWTTAAVAESFMALVSDGQSTRSYNTTAESLTVSQLECGTAYTLTVASVNGECVSRPSVVPVQEIPCLPTGVAAHTLCNGTSIDVSWASARGASNYQVTAYDQGGGRRSCVTNSTWCRLDAVTCGQVYDVVLSAENSECSSNGTTALIVPTAPCPPTHLSASINCTTNAALLAWVGSGYAESYTASAVSTGQHQVACNTATPGCRLDDLQCGEQYNVTVSSSDGECTSTSRELVVVTTAPCVVLDVVVSLNCSSNALTVSWTPTSAPLNYSASAVAADGAALSCLTEHSHCTLWDLACGERYEVSVRAACDTCVGPSSALHVVHTAPCVPEEVRGDVDCSSNSLLVSWKAASGATSYVSSLTDVDGVVTSCASTDLACVFPDLPCARTYWLSVTARGDQCDGSESSGISVITAPCEPTHVTVDLDCVSGAATVKWTQSAGARFYTVVAEAGTSSDSCRTSNATCQLGALHCGEDYTISVLAGDGACNSSVLARTTLSTGPCPPAALHSLLDCTLNTAVVSWRPDVNALSVTVTAESELADSATCSSANHSCVLSQLQCGRVYHVNAVAHGALCHSNVSERLDIVTAPCTPTHVEHTYSCDTGIALLTWDDSLGRSGFHVDVVSQDHAVSCSTSDTYCSFTSLLCGHVYNTSVTAVADRCNSSASTLTSIQTAPCAPANLGAALLCDNNTASVTWESSPGAETYKVLAQSHDGDVKHCVTGNTSCLLPSMHCSQTYLITVTPMSAQCTGIQSPPLLYMAGSCPPTDVRLTMQCVGNVGHVSWSSVLRAEMYVAVATSVGMDVPMHECSSNGTSCSLSDLPCGETLSISVVTEERDCRSVPSPPFTFQSAVCPPMTVEGVASCSTNDITVSWDASARSPATYIVHAQKAGGASATYSTSDTSQMIGGLVCGEAYALSVAVLDSECTSAPSDPIRTETAPCPPTNLTVQTECGTNLGIFSWSASLHAVSYVVDVIGPQGHAAHCSSNSTSCSVKLDCGRRYTAVVIASSLTCNSSEGASTTFDSAPCLPDQVVASVQCSDNSMSVQWRGSAGELLYTAIAIGSDQSRLTCNTTGTNCTIQSLRCGLTYSVVVTTPNVDCGTIQGSDYQVQSAPCRPDTLNVDVWCSSNVAYATWQNAGPDQTQVVTATDPRGVTTTCSSIGSNCTFDTLTCGETYTVSVAGHTETCSLASVTAVSVNMAPCLATHVTATLDCHTGISVVMWDASRGAITYTVSANGSAGFNAACHSGDSYCDFLNLECGQEYSISVVGHNDVCTGPVSRAINLTTGPCPHSDLQTSLDCSTNTALVSWRPGRKILYYNATAAGFNVGHQESCSTSGAACNISGLLCGEAYKVTVSGQGQNCPSPGQDWTRLSAAPCPPTQLHVIQSCESNDILVSWQPSKGSASYRAIALDAEGQQLSCSTDGGSCNITGLVCGRSYQVYAVAVHETCESLRSDLREIHTAPCVPQEVVTHLDCLSGAVNISWNSSGFAPHFHVSVLNGNGEHHVSETDIHHCKLENLQCSHTYNVTVTTTDGSCHSKESNVTHLTTAPCPPPAFTPSLDCTTGTVSVTWMDSMVGVVYEVLAEDAVGRRHHCNGSDSCDLTTLDCGSQYNISVTASRDGCVGRASPTQLIATGPCPPHLSSVEIDCLTNSAWVTLGEAASGDSYVIIATDGRGLVQNFGCNSSLDGVCELPPLACSETFSFTAQASDHECSSGPSNKVFKETGPCPPESVAKWVSCENRSVNVSWAAVGSAISYTATLEPVDGDSHCCTVADTSCDIRHLPCGQMFMLLVSAEGRTCNSSQSDGDIVMTGPCVPQDLRSSLNCLDNVASMSWNHSRGGQLYRVTAVSADGHVDQCTSYENRCELTGLQCGAVYNATVTAEDQVCQSEPSQQVIIKTVPCSVTNVSSVVDCEGGSLTVSWSQSLGADSYVAKLQDSGGQSTTCASQQGSCGVTGLSCGQVYHVSVVASDGYCESNPTESTPAPPVPCPPRLVAAEMDCESGIAVVTWHPGDGAVSYVVAATSSDHNETCISNSTHCDLHSLQCGRSYAVSVTAVGDVCSSVGLMTSPLVAEPCIPEDIRVLYSVSIGQVMWGQAAGADSYSVMGVSASGSSASCSTADTFCVLYDLSCSQMYTVNVSAHNQVCQRGSVSLQTVSIETEPCPPADVQTSLQCESNSAVVFWEASYGAVGYQVHLAGRDGHTISCYTEEEFCKLEGLHCGGVYHTFVVAVGGTLNSSESATVLLTSAPCAVLNMNVDLDCSNDSADVSWSATAGASMFSLTAVSAEGHQVSWVGEEMSCQLTDLQCSRSYNISIAAISEGCRTESREAVSIRTRPCQPQHVSADVLCGSSTASMSWEEGEGVEFYLGVATSSSGERLQCNSSLPSCSFFHLSCGDSYLLSVQSCSQNCCSTPSRFAEVTTEPCRPQNVTVEGSCDNNTVVVTWAESAGALSYLLTVSGDLGYVTSFQTDGVQLEAELLCGQLFTLMLHAQDDHCSSEPSEPQHFKTGPCIPHDVQSFMLCEDDTGAVSWAESDGADSYIAIAVGQDGHTHVCTSNTTSCIWDDLHCGEVYTAHIVANDFLCSSMPSNSTTIRTASCIPDNLRVALNCSMKVASVSWDPSETALSYVITAETNEGHKLQQSANSTTAFFSELLCGQLYFLSVQAVDSECISDPSAVMELNSVPCPPAGVSSSINCVSNIAVVSWRTSLGAEFYTATVMQEDGQSESCWSDIEHCGMSSLNCGMNHSVTVVASDQSCNSDPSEVHYLQSVPCVPKDVDVKMDCYSGAATISWASSRGATSYSVYAQSSLGATSTCDTLDLNCTLTNLTCGHVFTVRVAAQDDVCSSLQSPAQTFHSVPCTPVLGSAVLDCITNSALLDWSFTEGAQSYFISAGSTSGHVSTCVSNLTHCELPGLFCGEAYEIVAYATNQQCRGAPSNHLQLQSAPCAPEDVVVDVDCSTNVANVTWAIATGADFYVVQAVGVEEHESGCESADLSCTLSDLLCGFIYNVSVTAVNQACNVSRSAVTQIRTVPCVPQQVEAQVNCESGALAVSWEPSRGAWLYTVVAQGNGGYASTCNSSETSCWFSDLLCGLDYTVTVTAADGSCSTAGSSALPVTSVPCVPQMVAAEMECESDIGMVTWEEGEGVDSYSVRGVGSDGHSVECHSSANNCSLPSMHCGQRYNLSVTAQDKQCHSSPAQLSLQSVPCQPTAVRTALQCQAGSVAVAWEHSSGALFYSALGEAAEGHQTACNNTETHCDLIEPLCGRSYNVTVSANDLACSSAESAAATVLSAPCPPQNVVVTSLCEQGAILVAWSHDHDVDLFQVKARSDDQAELYCDTSSSSCTIRHLPCGRRYNVTVTSVRDDCESKASTSVMASSAPCVPQNVMTRLDCVSNSAWVTWDEVDGAESYQVLGEEVGTEHNSTCSSASSPCNVPDLKCGTQYVFHVRAINRQCSGNQSQTMELETGPCGLSSISVKLACEGGIMVEWTPVDNTQLYLVTAEASDLAIISCNSSTDSCILTGVKCDETYSVIVSASSDKCSGLRSPPSRIHTAPCAPADVRAIPSCDRDIAEVTWNSSPVAKSYHLTAHGEDGHMFECHTQVNNCSLTGMRCSHAYNLSVVASGDNCSSPATTATMFTVPCAPPDLVVVPYCHTNSALLSWTASPGASQYFGSALSSVDSALSCDSIGTTCYVSGLECSRTYNFSVVASDGVCNSSHSATVTAGAVPCPPEVPRLKFRQIGQKHWAQVSWTPVPCPQVEYLVEVSGQINNSPQARMNLSSYWLSRPYFETPLPCSTSYNLTVRARNAAGVSDRSDTLTGFSVPCAPETVTYSGDSESAAIMWTESTFATSYNVYNVSLGVRVLLCQTDGLSCQLSDFSPTSTEVTASNDNGESFANTNITGPVERRRRRDLRASKVHSGFIKDLEIPMAVKVEVRGASLHVTWTPVADAADYKLVFEEYDAKHRAVVRVVEGNSHEESSLRPQTRYCLRLAARNNVNRSSYSRPVCRTTGQL